MTHTDLIKTAQAKLDDLSAKQKEHRNIHGYGFNPYDDKVERALDEFVKLEVQRDDELFLKEWTVEVTKERRLAANSKKGREQFDWLNAQKWAKPGFKSLNRDALIQAIKMHNL